MNSHDFKSCKIFGYLFKLKGISALNIHFLINLTQIIKLRICFSIKKNHFSLDLFGELEKVAIKIVVGLKHSEIKHPFSLIPFTLQFPFQAGKKDPDLMPRYVFLISVCAKWRLNDKLWLWRNPTDSSPPQNLSPVL